MYALLFVVFVAHAVVFVGGLLAGLYGIRESLRDMRLMYRDVSPCKFWWKYSGPIAGYGLAYYLLITILCGLGLMFFR